METKLFVIPYYRPDIFRFHPVSDEHLGPKHCAEEKVKRDYRKITNDPLSFFIQIGDAGDFIAPKDPRWQFGTIADWLVGHEDNILEYQKDAYCQIAKPAVDAEIGDYGVNKCVGKLFGNHEWAARTHLHTNVQENICKQLGIDDLGFSCIVHFVFRRINSNESHMFKGAFTHGSGNAQTRGGKLMKLRKVMNQFNVDFVCHAHMHDIIIETANTLKTNGELVIGDAQKLGCVTGGYLRTYTQGIAPSYGEMRNYDPTPLGHPIITFYPDQRRMTITKE